MATESFFEDMIINTPEAIANLIAFVEKEPHVITSDVENFEDASEEYMKDLIEMIHSKKW